MAIIYKTTNQITGNYYIGFHSRDLDSYLGSGVAINDAIEKYGRDNFIRETVFEGTDEECIELEEFIVDLDFIGRPDTYNIAEGGGMPPRNFGHTYNRGRKLPPRTPEQRARYSKGMTGYKQTPEHREKIRQAALRREAKKRGY